MKHRLDVAIMIALGTLIAPNLAMAWGDEGHEIVGLIADHYLSPTVRDQVHAMLATDITALAAGTDISHEATWADKYRDAANRTLHYTQTQQWHFVDIEVDGSADIDAACFHFPALPSGTPASAGPAQDCVVEKINEFAAELKDPATSAPERLMALQFLLHFVGDVHQPLHASDSHDSGGNAKSVKATGLTKQKLHHYWDTEFVEQLGGTDPTTIATTLIGQITDAQVATWSASTPSDWAQESFALAHDHAYAMLPQPDSTGTYNLTPAYVQDATQVVSGQLQKAGVRLASLLNSAVSAQPIVSCSVAARAASIPDLTTFAGMTITTSDLSSGGVAATWQGLAKSSLTFDPGNSNGLPKSLETFLQQKGWTLVEAENNTHSYQSRWQVPLGTCPAQTGLLSVAPSDDATQFVVQVRIVAF